MSFMEKSAYVDAEDTGSFAMVEFGQPQDEENQGSFSNVQTVNGEDSEDDVEVIKDHVSEDEEPNDEGNVGNVQSDSSDGGNQQVLVLTESEEEKGDPSNVKQLLVEDDSSDNALLDLSLEKIGNVISALVNKEKEALDLAKAESLRLKGLIASLASRGMKEEEANPMEKSDALPSTSKQEVIMPLSTVSSMVSWEKPEIPEQVPPSVPKVEAVSSSGRPCSTTSSDSEVFSDMKHSFAPKPKRKYRSASGEKIEKFFQNHQLSLDALIRNIIFSCLISFVTAWIVLSFYSAQTHKQDMELYNLKEKEISNQNAKFEKMQERYENFRESMIHKEYEDARACRDTLKTCHSGKDDFLIKISKIEENANTEISKLMTKVETQNMEITSLREENNNLKRMYQELVEERNTLVVEHNKSLVSILIQVLVDLLKNKGVQIIIAGTIVLAAIPVIFSSSKV